MTDITQARLERARAIVVLCDCERGHNGCGMAGRICDCQLSPDLPVHFSNAFPDGSVDVSTYSDIEEALDRAEAPSTEGARWLTLPERIAALAAFRRVATAKVTP